MKRNDRQHGFTVLEVLISIAVFGILSSISLSGYQASRQRSVLTSQVNVLSGLIRDTQRLSIAAEKGQAWKLKCSGATVSQYLQTSAIPERMVELAEPVSCVHEGEITFSKLTGTPVTPATFEVSMPGVGSRTITVTASGAVEETTP